MIIFDRGNEVSASYDGPYGGSDTSDGTFVQDGGGRIIKDVNNPWSTGLSGNAWKAFELESTVMITKDTWLKFNFEYIQGHLRLYLS